MKYTWDDSVHGHSKPDAGDDLHKPEDGRPDAGEHWSTPPTTSGRALERHEAKIRRHLAEHASRR